MHAVDYKPLSGMDRGRFQKPPRRIGRNTLTHQVLYAWFNISRSVRDRLDERPGEGRLLYYLLWSNLAFFLSWTMKAVIVPNAAGVGLISVEIGLLFVAAVVGRTAVLYVFAMVIAALCRIAGGTGSWRDTRIAVFWGAFVAAPFGVAAAGLSVLYTNLEAYYPIFGAPWISHPPYYFGMLPFVWYISIGVTRAQGFRSIAPVFLSMSIVALVALLGGMYFHANGMI